MANNLTDGDACKVNLVSHADGGFTAVTCQIDSPSLDEATLAMFQLTTNLDLANTPDGMAESLVNFGFPANIAGQKEASLDLAKFIQPLASLGEGLEHKFIITVTDANGSVTKTLILVCE